jgi:hypothetical protein
MEQQLGELLSRIEKSIGSQGPPEEEGQVIEPPSEQQLSPADRERIETLFDQAEKDRSKAFELKQVLDRLGVFKEYEDRFLDLFKKTDK